MNNFSFISLRNTFPYLESWRRGRYSEAMTSRQTQHSESYPPCSAVHLYSVWLMVTYMMNVFDEFIYFALTFQFFSPIVPIAQEDVFYLSTHKWLACNFWYGCTFWNKAILSDQVFYFRLVSSLYVVVV